jgi:hypothetical protein
LQQLEIYSIRLEYPIVNLELCSLGSKPEAVLLLQRPVITRVGQESLVGMELAGNSPNSNLRSAWEIS